MNLLDSLAFKTALFGVSSLVLTYGAGRVDWPNHPRVMKTTGALLGSASAIVLVIHAEKLHELSQLTHTYKRARLQTTKQIIVNKVVEGLTQSDPARSVRDLLENAFRMESYTAHPAGAVELPPKQSGGELATASPSRAELQPTAPEDSFAETAHRFIDYLVPRLIKLTDESGWIEVETLRANWGKDNGLSSRAAMEAFLDRLAHAQVGEWHPENDNLWRVV